MRDKNSQSHCVCLFNVLKKHQKSQRWILVGGPICNRILACILSFSTLFMFSMSFTIALIFYVLLLGVKTMHKILSNTLQSSKLRFFSLLYADHFDDVILKKKFHLFQPISSAIFIIFPFNFHLLYLACILLYSTFFFLNIFALSSKSKLF